MIKKCYPNLFGWLIRVKKNYIQIINQKLINLLNFRAGDQEYTWDYYFIKPKVFKNNENKPIETFLKWEFQDSKKSKEMFNYSSFLATLNFNYIVQAGHTSADLDYRLPPGPGQSALTLNGGTKGGQGGDELTFVGISSSLVYCELRLNGVGTIATPFSTV